MVSKLEAIPKLTGASRARAGQSARKHSGRALLRKVSWQPVRPLAFLQIPMVASLAPREVK